MALKRKLLWGDVDMYDNETNREAITYWPRMRRQSDMGPRWIMGAMLVLVNAVNVSWHGYYAVTSNV